MCFSLVEIIQQTACNSEVLSFSRLLLFKLIVIDTGLGISEQFVKMFQC